MELLLNLVCLLISKVIKKHMGWADRSLPCWRPEQRLPVVRRKDWWARPSLLLIWKLWAALSFGKDIDCAFFSFFCPSPIANAQISMSGPRISAATVVLPCYLHNLQPRKTFKYVNGTSKQSPKLGRVYFPHFTDKEIVFYPKYMWPGGERRSRYIYIWILKHRNLSGECMSESVSEFVWEAHRCLRAGEQQTFMSSNRLYCGLYNLPAWWPSLKDRLSDETSDFIFLGYKITEDCDCSHEIKRCLLLGRKGMTILDSVLKSRHHCANKGPYCQSHGFSSSRVWM